MSNSCVQCGDSTAYTVCRACDMDWEWFMNLKVVDLEREETSGYWLAPRDGEMVIVAESTEELRALIRRQPVGRDRGGSL